MKVCNAEAMKMIKELEEEKRMLIYNEDYRSTVSYKEGETKGAATYEYQKTRERVAGLDSEIRRIRFAIAKANCEIMVDGFDITISEALVLLAQLRGEYEQLKKLSGRMQISRRITTTGVVEYTECLYDVAQVEQEQKALNRKIGKLQVAIDRANLTNVIEV